MRPDKENLLNNLLKVVLATKVVDLFKLLVCQTANDDGAWFLAALDDRYIAAN